MIENLEDFNLTCYLHLNIIMTFYVAHFVSTILVRCLNTLVLFIDTPPATFQYD